MADMYKESSGGDQGPPKPPPSKKCATLKLSDLWGSGGKPASQPVPTKKVDDKPCKEGNPNNAPEELGVDEGFDDEEEDEDEEDEKEEQKGWVAAAAKALGFH
ncbi:hypothetical protein VOLCADRAFT_104584 [Volvox carteri f. nagariensis]|uniref:Uncharacterized protein n=1 Tax=Volvox carteri f. nagariensis TaxID=3068 RepID=D8TUN0_VOLCA|nr:uncharacterized protein VOLCADRAFT_104584 [Volvox carteri f. nagariensis]EFJ48736.1 hypothetical protein VOLCADRAFT_104584 [Volvox carteri f. nagariensis]|eukprot:XP_002950068.1 hypothetical protein VOLCADRAFT_104584 [Volvox carteri f. nagariensis]